MDSTGHPSVSLQRANVCDDVDDYDHDDECFGVGTSFGLVICLPKRWLMLEGHSSTEGQSVWRFLERELMSRWVGSTRCLCGACAIQIPAKELKWIIYYTEDTYINVTSAAGTTVRAALLEKINHRPSDQSDLRMMFMFMYIYMNVSFCKTKGLNWPFMRFCWCWYVKYIIFCMSADTPPFPEESFDRILLDAPCSGLGQRPNMAINYSLKEVCSYQPLQRKLFRTVGAHVHSWSVFQQNRNLKELI